MSTTPLTRNECYDARKVQARLATHDDRMDDIEAMAIANEVGDGTITTAKLDDDALSADSDGRGKMEDDFFDAATVLAKFDADSFDNAQLILAVKDGAFNADAATRALFDDGIWNTAKLGTEVRGAHQSLSGPGAVNLTTPVTRCTSTGSNDALTLADATVNGFRKTIIHAVDGGSVKLTAGGSLHLGDSLASITMASAFDWVMLEWQTNAYFVVGWAGAGVTFA